MLDLLYAQAARSRRRWYERRPERRRSLARPVISVGNLSVGGTGKTPLVVDIVRGLLERGERPAVLSRGYARRRRRDGVVVVSDGHRVMATVDEAGDEPVMIARGAPGAIVVVCEDRVLAGRLAEHLGCTVHVLDDGFQQVGLRKDLEVLVTFPGEIGTGRVLPLGRLREPADAAARAHVVVVVGADEAAARSEAWTLGVSQAVGARRVLLDAQPATIAARERVVAFAGIGQPAQFFDGLREQGWDVARELTFPDHHRYRASDLARIAGAVADTHAAAAITTAKDAVRLEESGPLPFAFGVVPLALALDRRETLEAAIDEAIARFRADEVESSTWPPLEVTRDARLKPSRSGDALRSGDAQRSGDAPRPGETSHAEGERA